MENLKENIDFIYEFLKPFLKIGILFSLMFFILSGFVFFTIQIDKSNLDDIMYCPNCGQDLIQHH